MATNGWPIIPLGDVTINLDSIRVPVKEAERRPGPYPYYGASGVVDHVDGYLFEGDHLLIAEDGENLRTRQTPIAFMATGKFWVNNHAHIVKGNDRALTRFLCYALSNTDISGYLSGSTMPKLTQGNMNRIPVLTPPLSVQERIVDVLGSLDDKIELNRRMNETLEAMARRLFKSWFIDFDPVHAKAALRREHPKLSNADLSRRALPNMAPEIAELFPDSFEDSTLGLIPMGWKPVGLGDVVEILDSRRIPLSGREREQRQGKYPYHGAADVMDHVDDFLFEGVHVLMGEDGSVVNEDGTPVLQYVWGKFWVNNHAHVLKGAAGVSSEHIYLHLKPSNIAAFVTGAVQPKLNQANLKRIDFLKPSLELNQIFEATVAPWFARVRDNANETQELVRVRDKLLPRLLSGELAISSELS